MSSLLKAIGRSCTVVKPSSTPDGAGGKHTKWQPAHQFTAYMGLSSAAEQEKTQRLQVQEVQTVLVDAAVSIHYNERFVDDKNGQAYRVTSHPETEKAPRISTLELKYFTAIREALPQ